MTWLDSFKNSSGENLKLPITDFIKQDAGRHVACWAIIYKLGVTATEAPLKIENNRNSMKEWATGRPICVYTQRVVLPTDFPGLKSIGKDWREYTGINSNQNRSLKQSKKQFQSDIDLCRPTEKFYLNAGMFSNKYFSKNIIKFSFQLAVCSLNVYIEAEATRFYVNSA